MTINEFKAWLAGFSHTFSGGIPSAEQWQEILQRINEIKAAGRPGKF